MMNYSFRVAFSPEPPGFGSWKWICLDLCHALAERGCETTTSRLDCGHRIFNQLPLRFSSRWTVAIVFDELLEPTLYEQSLQQVLKQMPRRQLVGRHPELPLSLRFRFPSADSFQ